MKQVAMVGKMGPAFDVIDFRVSPGHFGKVSGSGDDGKYFIPREPQDWYLMVGGGQFVRAMPYREDFTNELIWRECYVAEVEYAFRAAGSESIRYSN